MILEGLKPGVEFDGVWPSGLEEPEQSVMPMERQKVMENLMVDEVAQHVV